MYLTRMDDEKAGGRRFVMHATVEEFSSSSLDQTELILLMPVSRIGCSDGDATSQFQPWKVIKPPNVDLLLSCGSLQVADNYLLSA